MVFPSTDVRALKNNPKLFKKAISNSKGGRLKNILCKLGRIDDDSYKEPLCSLLDNNKSDVRALAVKNLAKIQDKSCLNTFKNVIQSDSSSAVRREAVSAIGRSRDEETIDYLYDLLADSDPGVVMQAIRGLLVFKNNPEVKRKLLELEKHPNEIIQEVISKELMPKSTNFPKLKHPESIDFLKNLVVHGDVLKTLKLIPDESIHLTFTSPPYYNARDYSIYKSYTEYLNFLKKVFEEIHRTTKEGRFFVLNTSPIIMPRFSRQYASKRYPIPYDLHNLLMKGGWEFIDDIVWVKPEASVKNRNAGFLQHRKPLGYKANSRSEMVMVYRKKSDKLLDWNIKQYPVEVVGKSKVSGKYETSNIWNIDPTFDKTHSAVFPIELCNRVIKFYSFEGDLVFDPFGGSGTFAKSALSLNRFFLLTEISEKYVDRIKENIAVNTNLSENYKKPKIITLDKFKEDLKNDPNFK